MSKINQVILFYQQEIKSLLNDDQIFKMAARENGIINNQESEENFAIFFENCILRVPTKVFQNLLITCSRQTASKRYVELAKSIEYPWSQLVQEVKKYVREKFVNISMFKDKKILVNYENIMAPVLISTYLNNDQVDDVKTSDDFFKLSNIIYERGDKILIKGGPGMGKTYHFRKILCSWATGDKRDCLLLNLQLKKTDQCNNIIDELYKHNFSQSSKISRSLFACIFNKEFSDFHRKIFILIDGADKFATHVKFLNKIFTSFSRLVILVWSRNWKAYEISNTYNHVYEIFGYDEIQKKIFFDKFFYELHKNKVCQQVTRQRKLSSDDPYQDVTSAWIHNRSESDKLWQYLWTKRKDLLKSCSRPLVAFTTAAVWEETKECKEGYIFEKVIDRLLKKKAITRDTIYYEKIINHCSEEAYNHLFRKLPIKMTDIIKKSSNIGNLLMVNPYQSAEDQELAFIDISFLEYFAAKHIINCLKSNANCEQGRLENSVAKQAFIRYLFDHNLIELKFIFRFIRELYPEFFSILPAKKSFPLEPIDDDALHTIKHYRNERVFKLCNTTLAFHHLNPIVKSLSRNVTTIQLMKVSLNLDYFLELITTELSLQLINLELNSLIEDKSISVKILTEITRTFVKLKSLFLINVPLCKNLSTPVDISSNSVLGLTLQNCCFSPDMIRSFSCQRLYKLNLSFNKIEDQKFKNFINCLKSNRSLKAIDFSFCQLSDTHFDSLKTLIEENRSLTEISLQGNDFNIETTKSIGSLADERQYIKVFEINNYKALSENDKSFIAFNPNLEVLTLSKSTILSPVIEKIIQLKNLVELGLSSINIKWIGNHFIHLESFVNLKIFDFSYNDITNQKRMFHLFKEILSSSFNLKKLVMNNCNINPEGLNILGNCMKKLSNLTFINISNNNLDCDSFEEFLKFKIFTEQEEIELDCSNCHLESQNLVSLLKLPKFKILNFSQNYISECYVELENIAFFQYLRELYLRNCNLPEEFLQQIGRNLESFSMVQILDISENNFKDRSLNYFFERVSTEENNLKEIYIYGNEFSKYVISNMYSCIKSLPKLSILNSTESVNDSLFNQSLNELVNSKKFNLKMINSLLSNYDDIVELKILQLSLISGQRESYLHLISELEIKIKFIIFDDILSPSESLEIKKIIDQKEKTVEKISINEHFMKNTDFSLLSANFNLTSLKIAFRSEEIINSEIWNLLSGQEMLKTLYLSRVKLEDRYCQNYENIFINRVSKLEELKIFSSTFCGATIRNFISRQEHLKVLEINESKFDNLFDRECKCRSLKKLTLFKYEFSREEMEDFKIFLNKQSHLEKLNLKLNNLKDNIGLKIFSDSYRNDNNTITELSLHKCKLSVNMADKLGLFIGRQTNLEVLDLSGINMQNKIGCNLFRAISEKCCNILDLKLGKCTFSRDMAEYLIEFIDNQKRLNVLDLNSTDLSVLNTNKEFHFCYETIICLNLHHCTLSEETAYLFGRLIRHEHLDILNVSNLRLEECGSNLFETSGICSTISEINLSETTFSSSTAKTLGIFLGYAVNLKTLNLSKTNLTRDIGKQLFSNISCDCCKIINLNLSLCKFSASMAQYLGIFIKYQDSLNTLDLSRTDLTNEIGTNIFSRKVDTKYTKYISSLILVGCLLCSKMSTSLGIFIECQNNLSHLNLSHTILEGSIGKNLFEHASHTFPTILTVNLKRCKFSSDMVESLAKFIGKQINLTELNLSSTDLSQIEKELFTEISKSCYYVRNLNIQNSTLSNDQTTGILQFIECQKYLTNEEKLLITQEIVERKFRASKPLI
ncbi:DgyrCDS9928 [Dimorphilus gyrociliatus]|uniref:DgyrCDS9928 n=1 Tax=Dimorphilus gyrociliatus TaxID=2664684 RepID=A0A7I8VYV9_9ANNE|nr:DgyrCDS9928 [Dimorphilus gyrociliatus]